MAGEKLGRFDGFSRLFRIRHFQRSNSTVANLSRQTVADAVARRQVGEALRVARPLGVATHSARSTCAGAGRRRAQAL